MTAAAGREFDALLTESCFADRFCSEGTPYRRLAKAHFDLEYVDRGMTRAQVCPWAARQGIAAVLKRSTARLDGWRRACPR